MKHPSPGRRLALRRRAASRRQGRRGAATVELALCMPILLTIGLGMIETSNVVFIQTRMQSAAYEAARLATRPTTSQATAASNAEVTAYCQALLTQLGVNGATVTVTPGNLVDAEPQTLVTVTVSAPWNQNSVTSFVLKNSPTFTTSVSLVIE
ncbi:MAG TPA: TadE/TadG family type IV pilus assembly protein [Pirellulales bacterium]|nr:TadE/TadG family type IV pilus assembly protein [Pirellulales bacterium]